MLKAASLGLIATTPSDTFIHAFHKEALDASGALTLHSAVSHLAAELVKRAMVLTRDKVAITLLKELEDGRD